jgi:hypothetical protein
MRGSVAGALFRLAAYTGRPVKRLYAAARWPCKGESRKRHDYESAAAPFMRNPLFCAGRCGRGEDLP